MDFPLFQGSVMNDNWLAAKENRHRTKDKTELNQTNQREPIAQL